MPVKFSNPKTLALPPGYTSVVEVTGPVKVVYFAGQLGIDTENKFVGAAGDFRAQCEQAFENMSKALDAAGARWSDVVKINNYLVDIERNMAAFRAVRDRFLGGKAPPASTTIGVPALARPGGLFEIEAVAVVARRSNSAARRGGAKTSRAKSSRAKSSGARTSRAKARNARRRS